MVDTEKKHKEDTDLWRELRKEDYQHWRAWGSWFSWGSPTGLGLFFVLLAVTFAIFKWAISL